MERLNRKGIFFSFISIILSIFFMVFFSGSTDLPLDHSVDSVQFRINFIDDYRESMIDYMESALLSVSYNSLYQMAEFVSDTGSSISPKSVFDSYFQECLLNGTLNSGAYNCSAGGKSNVTFHYWLDSFVNMSSMNLSLNTSYSVLDVNIYEEKPFLVTVNMTIQYEIIDITSTLVNNLTIVQEVPIEGIRDPLGNFYFSSWDRRFKETDIKETDWNLASLENFTQEMEYRHKASGPSFIMRFANDVSSSTCCGLETVLWEGPGPSGDPITYKDNRSYIDYLYFDDWNDPSSFDCEQTYEVGGLSPPVRIVLDEENLAAYNISTSLWDPPPC